MALGANASLVLGAVLRGGALACGAGLAAGLAMSAALTRWLQKFLFGVQALDPVTFACAGGVLAVMALAAMLIPARRVFRLDPMKVLRAD